MPVDHPHVPPVDTMVELLRWRAVQQPDRVAFVHLRDGVIVEDKEIEQVRASEYVQ